MSGPTTSDEQRFTAIFDRHYDDVLRFVRRRVTDEAAQDVVAETFLNVWRNLESVPTSSLNWLYRAASYEISHSYRKTAQDRRLESSLGRTASSAPDPADQISRADRWAIAFGQLSFADQDLLKLVAWEGVSPAEGAFILECSVSTFKVRLHRARSRLLRLLGSSDELDISALPAAATTIDPPLLRIRTGRAAAAADIAHRTHQEESS